MYSWHPPQRVRAARPTRPILLQMLALLTLLAASASFAEPDPIDRLAADIQAGHHADILGMVMLRGGEPVVDVGSRKLKAKGLDIRSATKSVTALLVGIAIDAGQLEGVDVPIHRWLPGYAESFASAPAKRTITIEDLLTMRSGLDCNDWDRASPGHEDTMYRQRDWVGFWLGQKLLEQPGQTFRYCTGNVIALGRILANATGQPVDRYAAERLFEPLKIERARWERWNRGRDTDTGGHLRLHPRDLARIGQLLVDRGAASGRKVVSEAWLDAMTREHVAIPRQAQRYGYLWWLDATTRADLPATRLQMAWGNGGNYLIVLPELGTVIAFAGKRYQQPNQLEPLAWLGQRILPALAP
ncbi:MAG: serine hydrolase [Pseudomonadota bacterium]